MEGAPRPPGKADPSERIGGGGRQGLACRFGTAWRHDGHRPELLLQRKRRHSPSADSGQNTESRVSSYTYGNPLVRPCHHLDLVGVHARPPWRIARLRPLDPPWFFDICILYARLSPSLRVLAYSARRTSAFRSMPALARIGKRRNYQTNRNVLSNQQKGTLRRNPARTRKTPMGRDLRRALALTATSKISRGEGSKPFTTANPSPPVDQSHPQPTGPGHLRRADPRPRESLAIQVGVLS